MDTGTALLRSILASPEDDTPRVVYADWLQENGQPERAEFIRVQIELDRYRGRGCTDPMCFGEKSLTCEGHRNEREAAPLLAREAELFEHVAGPLTGNGIGSAMLTFRRGFLDRVECSSAAWLRQGDTVTARERLLRSVKFTNRPRIIESDRVTRNYRNERRRSNVTDVTWTFTNENRDREEMLYTFEITDKEAALSSLGVLALRRAEFDRRVTEAIGDPLSYFRAKWHGITFTIPPEPELIGFEEFVPNMLETFAAFTRFTDELRADIIRGLGIPPHLMRGNEHAYTPGGATTTGG